MVAESSRVHTLQTVQTISECIMAAVTVLALIRAWPMIRIFANRATLVVEIEQSKRQNHDLMRALEMARAGNDGLQIAINGISAEVKELSSQLNEMDRKWKLGISFICELLRYHESKAPGPLPRIPPELRDDIEDSLRARDGHLIEENP
jgi:hypothetical protein